MENPWDNDPIVGASTEAPMAPSGGNPWDSDPVVEPAAPEAPTGEPVDETTVMGFLTDAYDSIKNMTVDDVKTYLKENGELPGGIGGAVAGGILGFLSPLPGGALIGSILGGAAGSAGGSAYSDVAAGKDIDFTQAMKEGAISLGMDVATLGLGKYVGKPIWGALKARWAAGESPEALVKQLASGETANFETHLARMQSQDFLQDQGLSLTPFQVGVTDAWQTVRENLARTGIFSQNVFKNNEEAIAGLVKDDINKLLGPTVGLSPDDIGRGINEALSQGRKVMNAEYGVKLGEISAKLSNNMVDLKPLKSAIANFETRNVDALGNSILNKKTQSVIKELTDLMGNTGQAPANFLLDFDKALGKKINEVSSFGSASFDPVTAMELTSLSRRVKVRIRSGITGVSQVAGRNYKALQQGWSQDVTAMFPDINSNFVRGANKGAYSAIGQMFTVGDKVENIMAMMKSIDTAYSKVPKSEINKLSFRTADDAKEVIRRSYVEKQLGSLSADTLDPKAFLKEAKALVDPAHAKKVRAILGPHYGNYKKLVNVMASAGTRPESGLATLFMRGKEYGTLTGLGVGAAAGIVNVGTAAMSAGAILGGPVFLARAATNPKYVAKLIEIDKMGAKGVAMEKIVQQSTVLINKVVDDMVSEGLDEEAIIESLTGSIFGNGQE